MKGDKGAVGYFGLSYVEQNPDVKAVESTAVAAASRPSRRSRTRATAVGSAAVHLCEELLYKDNAAVRSYVDFYRE